MFSNPHKPNYYRTYFFFLNLTSAVPIYFFRFNEMMPTRNLSRSAFIIIIIHNRIVPKAGCRPPEVCTPGSRAGASIGALRRILYRRPALLTVILAL